MCQPFWRVLSRQYPANDLSAHVRQPEIAARVTVCQLFVVQSHQVQDGRVIIEDVDGVGRDLRAVLIGLAISGSGLDAGARAQTCESLGAVIPSFAVRLVGPARAPKFGAD